MNHNTPEYRLLHAVVCVPILEAVYHWLNYMQTVSNANILNEGSMHYPIVEALERKLHCTNVGTETAHPVFSSKQIDVTFSCWFNTKGAIELKYIRENTRGGTEQQRFFDDVMRLAYTGLDYNIFIVAGTYDDYVKYFACIGKETNGKQFYKLDENNPSGFYSTLFPLEDEECLTIEPQMFDNWKIFKDKYKPENDIASVCIRSLGCYPEKPSVSNMVIRAWSIEKVK